MPTRSVELQHLSADDGHETADRDRNEQTNLMNSPLLLGRVTNGVG